MQLESSAVRWGGGGRVTGDSIVVVDIVDGTGLQLFMLHNDVSLQYYIPCVSR